MIIIECWLTEKSHNNEKYSLCSLFFRVFCQCQVRVGTVQYSVECCTNFKLDVRIGVVFVSLSILISKHATIDISITTYTNNYTNIDTNTDIALIHFTRN
jgi:hypothetical protein